MNRLTPMSRTPRRTNWARSATRRLARGGALLLTSLIALALLLSACDLIDNNDDEDEAAQQQAQQQAADDAAPAPPPEPPRSSVNPPEPAALDAPTVYSIIRASLALVETDTDLRAATGLVTRDGRIIVESAAVAEATRIAVTLSNGDRIEDLTVEIADPISGLAAIGPINANLARRLPAVSLGDGEDLPIGANVFAVGFSGLDAATGASISAGVLSRRAEWLSAELTIFSSDASIPGGQAGLVLADDSGAVIGLATRSLAARGLFVSTGDLARQLAALPPPGENPEGGMAVAADAVAMDVEVLPGEDALAFMTMTEPGPRLSLTVTGEERGIVTVLDATGAAIDTATIVGGGAATVIVTELAAVGPYQVWLSTEAAEPTSYLLESEQMVASMTPEAVDFDDRPWDPEERRSLGMINTRDDLDVFTLSVRPGDVYEVRAESLMIDVYLYAAGGGLDLADDDGLGGLSGTDAMLRIAPTEPGELTLTVGSITGAGGYLISVDQIEAAAEAVQPAQAAAAISEDFPAFPDPPVIAMRGAGDDGSLATTAVSRGFDAGDGLLLVADEDGSFDITATIFAANGATARILVSDAASGTLVFQSTLTATCGGEATCVANLNANPLEAAGGDWIVAIEHGATGQITQWQVEVRTNDPRGS